MKKSSFRGAVYLFVAAFIWGVAFVAQSEAMEVIGCFSFSAIRFLLGAIVLIPVIFISNKVKKNDKTNKSHSNSDINNDKSSFIEKIINCIKRNKTVLIAGILAGLFLFVATNLQQFGIKYSTVGKSGFITSMYIVLVPILGLLLKKRVPIHVVIALILSVIGLYCLCINEKMVLSAADIYLILCALFFAIQILVIDYYTEVDGVVMSCVQFFTCAFLSSIPMILFESLTFAQVKAAMIPILYTGILSSGVAYTFQILGQQQLEPTIASMIMSLESAFSLLAGYVLLGQKLSEKELLGCVFMFVAVILSQLPIPNKITVKKNIIKNTDNV